jgi:hypothetical protein
MRDFTRSFLALLVLLSPVLGSPVKVFPEPQEMKVSGAAFAIDENVAIAISANASSADVSLARLLAAELASRHGLGVRVERMARVAPGRRVLLVGTVANPLVKEYAASHKLNVSAAEPGPEGYVLSVTPEAIVVAGSDDAGAFYGVQSLRQIIQSEGGKTSVPGVQIRDWPYMKFRGVKLYLPGRDNLGYFKRFVRDYMALYKYNKLIVEMNAAMRLDRHPELNAGSIDLVRDALFSRFNDPPGLWYHGINSSHWDTADGGILEKEEVANLVRWANDNHIEVIPELPTLTHSYYLLTRHREFAEIPQEEWCDTYCPSIPGVYKLVFDVYDEYIEVMKPKMVHIGHDEWRMPWGVCPRCRNKDPRELFAQDTNKIYDYLKSKGIRTAMWADHLLENVRGVKVNKPWWELHEYAYKIPGALSPEQVIKWIPKDILQFNWLWGYTDDPKFAPITNEQRLTEWGFESVFANMEASVPTFRDRTEKNRKIVGGVPSAWLATTEFNFGKDRIADFTGCADLVWSGRDRTAGDRTRDLNATMPQIRRNLSGVQEPSDTEKVVPVRLDRAFNAVLPGHTAKWQGGEASAGRKRFELAPGNGRYVIAAGSQGEDENGYPQRVTGLNIGQDASSLLFLHALAKPAASVQGYDRIFAFEDSADLLGWYEVVYEDGLVSTIPIRYNVNILDWENKDGRVAYWADTVACGADPNRPVSFYAYEWRNPRLGKVIKEIRLNGSTGFKNPEGKVIPSNAVLLAGVSVVPARVKPKRQDPPFPK